MSMKWEDKGLKTPLARAKGLGAARDGTTHWMHQRLTAIANVFLVLWLVWSLLSMELGNYDEVRTWLAHPLNSILMILTVISTFYHAVLGSQVIVEDYIHNEGLKLVKLISHRLIYFGLGVACIFSVLTVAL